MSRGGRAPLTWDIAWRFLRGRRSQLLNGTARAALAATALGVTALVVAMALMTGYREDLQRKLIGDDAAVGIYPVVPSAVRIGPELRAELEAIPGAVRLRQVAYGQGLLSSLDPGSGAQRVSAEVTVRGVDPGDDRLARAEQLRSRDAIPAAVIGAELARQLGVEVGDVMRLTALTFESSRPGFRYRTLRLSGTFTAGFADFDNALLVVERSVVEAISGGRSSMYEFALTDPDAATAVTAAAEAILGPNYLVSDYRDLNRELFQALRLQKIALFFALALIVLVSTFNVASTLMVMVRERMRDVGALGAMGMSPRRLWSIFVLYGGALGTVGTLIGVAVGWAICWVITTFELIRFDPEVAAIYFIDSVPFRVRAVDLLAIVAVTLALTLVACIPPAWRAARVEPSTALRYE
jgi:lipoprotein-releasing system permease protein